MILIKSTSSLNYVKDQFGGKGFGLYKLTKIGMPVPKWVGIPKSVFTEFCRQTGFYEKILTEESRQNGNLGEVAKNIRDHFTLVPLPDQLKNLILEAYRSLNAPAIAVRSSANMEDSGTLSFAGMLSSFLFVKNENDTLKYVKECWASTFSERCLAYCHKQGIAYEKMQVAVVLQEMIDCEKSGVAFTVDPVDDAGKNLLISAVYGIGEGLVSGELDADTYRVDRRSEQIEIMHIAKKDCLLSMAPEGGLKKVPVHANFQDIPALDHSCIQELAKVCLKIEKEFTWPQDIEWGVAQGKIFVLQSRPITTLKSNVSGKTLIWDNSNIAESYSGVTLPLTFTFARHAYSHVYRQLCECLHVPKWKVAALERPLQTMLGSFYGRVYYNLINWYKLLTIVPGFKNNKSHMETMMGVTEGFSEALERETNFLKRGAIFQEWLSLTWTAVKLGFFHWRSEQMAQDFLKFFSHTYDKFRSLPYDRMSIDELHQTHVEIETHFLKNWKVPIINDLLCMIYFGTFKKLVGKWLAGVSDTIQNDLLCGEGSLESTAPTRELISLAHMVNEATALRTLIQETPDDLCYEALLNSEFQDFFTAVNLYIQKYGHRCMSELKLEQDDLSMKPAFFFTCLKNYLKAGVPDLNLMQIREREVRRTAEILAKKNLSGIKSILFHWILKHTRRSVRNRENMRFCRTRIFGLMRTLYNNIGERLCAQGIISHPKDVFYLTFEEVRGCSEGTLVTHDLHGLISLRKKEYRGFQDIDPASRFLTKSAVYWRQHHLPVEVQNQSVQNPKAKSLSGIACCPGKVEGVARVVTSAHESLNLNGEILVAKRTDPGWIPLYPSISALLVEQGSLLSHSAVVAREMGIPTIVNIPGLTSRVRSGIRLRIDGAKGSIEFLDNKEGD